MCRKGFDTSHVLQQLRQEYHIEVPNHSQNWPLDKFTSPSNVGTSHELNILLNTWQSKTTSFQKLEGEEWKKWEDKFNAKESGALTRVQELQDQCNASPTHSLTPQQSNLPDGVPLPIVDSSAAPSSSSGAIDGSSGFVNTFAVLGVDGKQVHVALKPRRSARMPGSPGVVRNRLRTGNQRKGMTRRVFFTMFFSFSNTIIDCSSLIKFITFHSFHSFFN